MRRLALFASLIVLAAPAAAEDDPLLKRLAGDWVGRGSLIRDIEGDPELVFCRISNTLAADGTHLDQTGRCAIASNSAGMEISINALGNGQYAGTGNGIGLGSRGQATISGAGTPDRLDFTAELIDTATNNTAVVTAVIDVGVDGYRLRIHRTDEATGADYIASEVVFTPN